MDIFNGRKDVFLTFPFSWKGKLIQYVGRVQRLTEGKKEAFIHDYVDENIKMLELMYFKRLRTYRSLGLIKNHTQAKKENTSDKQLSLFS